MGPGPYDWAMGSGGASTDRGAGGGRGPDIYAVLAGMILVAAVLTWWIPAGRYERTVLPNGRETVVSGSYQEVERSPAGVRELITAIPDGLTDAASVVFLVLLVGGSVGVIRRAGVMDLGIRRLIRLTRGRIGLLIPALMFAFAAISGVVGMQELSIAWLPIVAPLLASQGCGRRTILAVALLGPSFGSAFGVTVPSTVGIGHQIAGLPMFSGASYRFAFFLLVQATAAWWVVRRARREIEARPATPTPDQAPPRETDPPAPSQRPRAAGIAALALFGAFVFGVLLLRPGFEEISGAFLAIAVIVSLIAGHGVNRICASFNESFREILVGALVCGLARGVAVVMTEGQVMDTVVFWTARLVESLPEGAAVLGILAGQAGFNFFVPSGSGQALVTLPVLVPVGDLSGITRQVVVLATQWGDGMTNVVFPTSGYFMATLVLAGVRLGAWLRYVAPLLLIVGGIAGVGLLLAQAISLGPF